MTRSAAEKIAWFALLYTVFVILWGTAVRFTGSGAGCGNHWPSCHGELTYWPDNMNSALEYGHRITSALCGLVIIVMLVATRRVTTVGHSARKWAGAALLFVLLEGALGAALVRLELVAHNASQLRALVVALHLVNTFTFASTIAGTVWTLGAPRWTPEKFSELEKGAQSVRRVALASLGLLLLVSMMGAVTALGDTLFPIDQTDSLAERVLGGTHFLERLRIYHPALASIASLFLILGPIQTCPEEAPPHVRRATLLVPALVVAQIGLGIANIALGAPGWMQILHLLFAVWLWLAVFWMWLGVRRPAFGDQA